MPANVSVGRSVRRKAIVLGLLLCGVLLPFVAAFLRKYTLQTEADPVSNPPAQLSQTNASSQVHDAGTILAGVPIRHTFSVINPFDERIEVSKEKARKNCACAELQPSRSDIEPRGEVGVEVVVNSSDLSGSFEKGGEVAWELASGEKWITKFVVRGNVVRALSANPEQLVFEPPEVDGAVSKFLEVKTSQAVDWNTLQVFSSIPVFKLNSSEVRDGVAVCTISCGKLAEGLESCDGRITIRVAARGAETMGGDQTWFDIIVPARARQEVDLVYAPRQPALIADSQGTAAGRIMLRGHALLASSSPVESVSSSVGQVKWSMGKINPSGSAVLEVSLTGLEIPVAEAELAIRFQSGKTLQVPVRVTRL